jgi:hypothetical protein
MCNRNLGFAKKVLRGCLFGMVSPTKGQLPILSPKLISEFRVTRRVCEKIAQNAAQPIFVKIKIQYLPPKK